MGKKRKRFDVKALNPRYKGAMMSDVARALMRSRNPKVQMALEKLQEKKGRPVKPDDPSEDPPGV